MNAQSTNPAEPVALTDTERLDCIKRSAENFAEGDTLSQLAQSEAVKALSGASFTQWEGARVSWETAYMAARAERASPVDPKSANKAWQRMVSAATLEKPKSDKPEAKAKSATRERNEAGEKALAMLDDAAIAESIDALRPFAAQLMPRAIERASTLMAEQSRRQKAREAAESQDTKKAREECVELLKAAPHEMLMIVRAILKGEMEVTLPEGETVPDLATMPLQHAA